MAGVLEKGKMEVPVEKLKALLLQLRQALLSRALPARSIASITGKIISMSIALGPCSDQAYDQEPLCTD